MAKQAGSSSGKISAVNGTESWSEADEAAMQALTARRGRVSAAIIGEARSNNLTDASKRRNCSKKDEEHGKWALPPTSHAVRRCHLRRAEVRLPIGVKKEGKAACVPSHHAAGEVGAVFLLLDGCNHRFGLHIIPTGYGMVQSFSRE